jgi:hypothetical protein
VSEGNVTYSFSTNGERFKGEYASREDAVVDASDEYETTDCVWTGRNVRVTAGRLASRLGYSIAERMVEEAYETVGEEIAEGWLDEALPPFSKRKDQPAQERARALIKDLDARIAAAAEAWATEHGLQPEFWEVADIQTHAPEPTT